MGVSWGTASHTPDVIRVPNPIQAETAPARSEFLPSNSIVTRNVPCNKNANIPRRIRRSTGDTQLYIHGVLASKKRRHIATNIQPAKTEQVCSRRQVSTFKCTPSPKFHTGRGLDGENRSKPCLFSLTSCQESQTIPSFSLCKQTMANDLPALRAQLSTKSFCKSNKLDSLLPEKSWCAYSGISRRLLFGKSRCSDITGTNQTYNRPAAIPRVENKHGKVGTHTTKSLGISWSDLGSLAKSKILAKEINRKNINSNFLSSDQKESHVVRLAKTHWHNELCQFRCQEGASALSRPSSTVQQNVDFTTHKGPTSIHSSHVGPNLVAKQLSNPITTSFSYALSLPYNRCKRPGLGCGAEQLQTPRNMDTVSAEITQQPKGDVGHPGGLKGPGTVLEFEGLNNTVRQQVSGSVPSQRRGNEISGFDGSYQEGISNSGSPRYSNIGLSHSGELQLPCRSVIAIQNTARVAPTPVHNTDIVQEVGYTNGRPVRITTRARSADILLSRPFRQTGFVLRCSEHELELPLSVGVSSTVSHPKSPRTSKQSMGNLYDGRAALGKRLLEARPEESCSRRAIHDQKSITGPSRRDNEPSPTECVRNDNRSMEMWGWDEQLSDWTNEQKQLLCESWRKSTLKTYKPAWRRWMVWAREKGISVRNPTGSNLARYLADLHQKEGLSLSTIQVHKSVVATLSNPDNHEKLSSHSLVKHVLKSIALTKQRPEKPPIWDTDILKEYLCTKNEDTTSLYEASKCTAAILLLCSGRRVHDLTLLKISPQYCDIKEDFVIFNPIFGSKTDSCTHKQSAWKLITNPDNKRICPVHWVKHLIHLSEGLRLTAKSDNLFLALTGKPRPASRTIIAGWVKKLLQEAGIQATAGSFRSAVASKNWVENFQLDDILARGNWKSVNTFSKFYCRNISSNNVDNSTSISKCFVPIND